jgi:predicted metal-binding membrane protein
MPQAPALERLLKRDRAITIAGLVSLCVLAWLYIAMGAGMGMTAWEMTAVTLFPHADPAPPPKAAWDSSTWALMIAMWWIMMIAMMTPSAAPTILLYARVHRHAQASSEHKGKLAATGAFTAGYLLAWFAFAAVATALQWIAERAELVSVMMMGSRSRALSSAVLIAAGLYQLSPLKNGCLAHCRAPASFLSRHWRPHALGALRLGALHGVHCIGCCWMLMALLFVGGVMNLVWVVALAVLVLIEKALPPGPWVGRVVGVLLLVWGVATWAVE